MTPEIIEKDWLSLRHWALRSVLPAALVLLALLLMFRALTDEAKDLNHSAVIVGFFALYFILVRGGHLIMIRSLHFELLRKHEDSYRDKLSAFPRSHFKRRNLGFTLAKIKRQIITEQEAKRDQFKR